MVLGDRGEIADDQIAFYAPQLDPIPCDACGSSHIYSSHDVFEFDKHV
jgi:hypothetical protein